MEPPSFFEELLTSFSTLVLYGELNLLKSEAEMTTWKSCVQENKE